MITIEHEESVSIKTYLTRDCLIRHDDGLLELNVYGEIVQLIGHATWMKHELPFKTIRFEGLQYQLLDFTMLNWVEFDMKIAELCKDKALFDNVFKVIIV